MHWTNTISRLVGRVADTPFPGPVQRVINAAYVGLAGVDLREHAPLATYRTLNELFTRRLAQPRQFDPAADALIAPVDGQVQGFGRLHRETMVQVKGLEYSVRELLTDRARHVENAIDGAYMSLYLSPRRYHGYHAPATLHVDRLIHVPGKLLPVNALFVNRVHVFAVNERVILEGRRMSGQRFWMVLVGATNVGSMTIAFEPELHTNLGLREPRVYEYAGGRRVQKGEYLGTFRMGSSVLLVAETHEPAPSSLGITRVRFGDPLPWPPAS
jgi:phosphatidylserine decarboxylase